MREFLLIGLEVVFGATLATGSPGYSPTASASRFPSGTLFINISGSLLLGFLLTFVGQPFVADPGLRLLLGTGFLGANTTFSTFSYDTIVLLERGDWLPALLYAGSSLFGSVFAAYAGVVLARVVG